MGDHARELARRARARSGPVEDYVDPDEDPEGPSAADLERFSGVTVTCAGCGTELMDDVSECWKCGRRIGGRGTHESGLPLWAVLTVVVVVLALAVWMLRVVM